jgi:hypothetical protein
MPIPTGWCPAGAQPGAAAFLPDATVPLSDQMQASILPHGKASRQPPHLGLLPQELDGRLRSAAWPNERTAQRKDWGHLQAGMIRFFWLQGVATSIAGSAGA